MSFSPKEILKFVEENDVKFIRLTFCDISGSLKNVAIMPNELERAFQYGIPFDASCINDRCSDSAARSRYFDPLDSSVET